MKKYTNEELQMRLVVFVGGLLGVILLLIVSAFVFGVIFVSQPMTQAPNDKEMFAQLSTISTFLTGTLSGIIGATAMNKIATKRTLTKKAVKDETEPPVDLP